MKILAIHIKNLASLEGAYTIDFTQEPLSSAGIFAITGPTGAGKSTILDALCLALYDKTPRFYRAEPVNILDVSGDEISQGDVKGILRDGTAEGYAKVEFVGVDGKAWEAAWQVRRARNKADGKLQQTEMTLKILHEQQYFPGKKTETLKAIEEKVGLSFDQFTRSVLLAQGDFTAFMKAGNHEKAALLEKLTGTAIYSKISMTVNGRYKEEKQALEVLQKEIGFIAVLDEEALKKLLGEKTQLQTLLLAEEQDISLKEQRLNRKKNLLILEQNLTIAQKNHAAVQLESNGAQERRQLWQQVERLQPARPIVEKIGELQGAIEEENGRQKSFGALLDALIKQKHDMDAASMAAEQQLQAVENRQEEALPKINQARGLEIQIKEQERALTGMERECAGKQKELKALDENFRHSAQQLAQLIGDLKANEDWLAANVSRRPVAEQMLQISERLESAVAVLFQVQEWKSQSKELSGKLKFQTAKKQDWQQAVEQLNGQIGELEKTLVAQQMAITAMPFDDWEVSQKKYAARILALSDARIVAQQLGIFLAEKKEWTATQSALDKQLIAEQSALATAEQELTQAKAVLVARRESLETVRLAAAGNVETMRANLQDDAPCPVCGSREHPYVLENPHFETALNQLSQDFEKARLQHEHWLTEGAAAEQRCRAIRQNQEQAQAALVKNEPLLQKALLKWQQLPVHQEAEKIAPESRLEWFDEQIKTTQTEQENIQQNISRFHSLKTEADEQRQVLDKHRQQLAAAEKDMAKTESDWRSLQEQLNRVNADQQTGTERLLKVRDSLNTYFPEDNWWENWQKNPADFLQKIQTFSKQWTEKKEQIARQNHDRALLEQNAENLQKQTKALTTEVQAQMEILERHHLALADIKTQRQLIFEGQSVDDVTLSLKNAITAAQSAVKMQTEQRGNLALQLTEIQTQLDVTKQRIARLSEQTKLNEDELLEWLDKFNQKFQEQLSLEELSRLLAYPVAWRETENQYFTALVDTLMRSATQLEEREKDLANALKEDMPEESIEGLTAQLKAVKEQRDLKKSRQHEIDFQLRNDRDNRQRLGDIQGKVQTQEKMVVDWGKLQDLIGSADGKKFRDIAQEYTLEVMLTYANVHLEALNKRYELQRIPGTLALQVIDHDMADEQRTVLSLSGGESFMTSLALALGLASLSSNQMTVESLFIDEGFGSLDPETLNIVMDALERLQHQGRKVGVISHVAEMTERIPVQIQVAKQRSGKSKLAVVQM